MPTQWIDPIRLNPRAAPVQGGTDAPLMYLAFNEEWFPHVMGLLEALHDGKMWIGDASEKRRAQEEVAAIMASFGYLGDVEAMYEFKIEDSLFPATQTHVVAHYYRRIGTTEWLHMGDVMIKDGQNGEDGYDGTDGTNGTDGADGWYYEPQLYEGVLPNGDPTGQWHLDFVPMPPPMPAAPIPYILDLPEGEPGTPGQDGQDGQPGADGQDGGYFLPDFYQGAPPRADGVTPLHPKFTYVRPPVGYNNGDEILHPEIDVVGPQGPQGPQGEQGEPGTPGQDGEPGTPGQDGQDGANGERGGYFLPGFYYGDTPRADGGIPIHPRFQYREPAGDYTNGDEIDYPTIDVLGARGAQGEQGEGGGEGKYWIPHTYQYPDGRVFLRWSDGDNDPAYDEDDPTTYLQTEHNIKGAAGPKGDKGDPGDPATIPPTTEGDTYCYVADRQVYHFANFIHDIYYDIDWVYDLLAEALDEVPFLSILGVVPELMNVLTDAIADQIVTAQEQDEARELLFCYLITNDGVTDSEIDAWVADFPSFNDAFTQYGPAGWLVWGILHLAQQSPGFFRESVRTLSARAAYHDSRMCEDYGCYPTVTDWGATFDFVEQHWGFLPRYGYSGTHVVGEGWHQGVGNFPDIAGLPPEAGVQIYRTFPTVGQFDRVGVAFEFIPQGGPKAIEIMVGGATIHSVNLATYGPGTYVIEWNNSDPVVGSSLEVGIVASGGGVTDGEVTLLQIFAHGPGPAPFS